METVDKIHEKKWKERREYDTWHSEHMRQVQLGWNEIQAKSINLRKSRVRDQI
jgi:hypothetical protein